eukprot:14213434-Ditylum_brightwellii.AAC.1
MDQTMIGVKHSFQVLLLGIHSRRHRRLRQLLLRCISPFGLVWMVGILALHPSRDQSEEE